MRSADELTEEMLSSYLDSAGVPDPELVIRPSGETSTGIASGVIAYRGDLMDHMIGLVNNSAVVKAQQDAPETDILTGLPFATEETETVIYTMDQIMSIMATLPADKQAELGAGITQMQAAGMPEQQICATISKALQPGASLS